MEFPNDSMDSILGNFSFSQVPDYLPNPQCSSTPKGTPKTTPKRQGLFKLPPTPKESRVFQNPVLARCHICKREYNRCLRNYKQQLKKHKMQELLSQFPDWAKIQEEAQNLAMEILKEFAMLPSEGEGEEKFQSFVQNALQDVLAPEESDWRTFVDSIICEFLPTLTLQKFSLPSTLHSHILQAVENILSTKEIRSHLEEMLSNICVVDSHILHSFFCDFVFALGFKIVCFIARNLRKNFKNPQAQPHIKFNEEQRNVIYYVGGSVIRGFYRMAMRNPRNSDWQNILKAIQEKIVEGEGVAAAASSDKYWTEFKNRDSLFFVGKHAMKFYLGLAKLLCTIVKEDGGLPHEEVGRAAFESELRIIWDEMIGSHLNEWQSVKFMGGVVQSFTNSYGKGNASRLRNIASSKPSPSQALRATLATNK